MLGWGGWIVSNMLVVGGGGLEKTSLTTSRVIGQYALFASIILATKTLSYYSG